MDGEQIAWDPTERYMRNSQKCSRPCIMCGRQCRENGPMIWMHCGGSCLVTPERGKWLNANGRGAADLGLQHIGPECLKRHPHLTTFVWRD